MQRMLSWSKCCWGKLDVQKLEINLAVVMGRKVSYIFNKNVGYSYYTYYHACFHWLVQIFYDWLQSSCKQTVLPWAVFSLSRRQCFMLGGAPCKYSLQHCVPLICHGFCSSPRLMVALSMLCWFTLCSWSKTRDLYGQICPGQAAESWSLHKIFMKIWTSATKWNCNKCHQYTGSIQLS